MLNMSVKVRYILHMHFVPKCYLFHLLFAPTISCALNYYLLMPNNGLASSEILWDKQSVFNHITDSYNCRAIYKAR